MYFVCLNAQFEGRKWFLVDKIQLKHFVRSSCLVQPSSAELKFVFNLIITPIHKPANNYKLTGYLIHKFKTH